MSTYTEYKQLEKPLSTDKYNVAVTNKNYDVIDSELHKLNLRNESQDNLLATKEALNNHTSNKNNPHEVTKAQIGLGNVDNTSDLDKPISIPQQNAIDEALSQSNYYTDVKVAALIDELNAAKEHVDSTHARTDATKVEKSDINGNIKINEVEVTVYTHPLGESDNGIYYSDSEPTNLVSGMIWIGN